MSQSDDMEAAARETTRLLKELDDALDQSSALCEILEKYDQLRHLERITGPSRITLLLREQIRCLEDRLGVIQA